MGKNVTEIETEKECLQVKSDDDTLMSVPQMCLLVSVVASSSEML